MNQTNFFYFMVRNLQIYFDGNKIWRVCNATSLHRYWFSTFNLVNPIYWVRKVLSRRIWFHRRGNMLVTTYMEITHHFPQIKRLLLILILIIFVISTVADPKSEIVTNQLHDQSSIFVLLLLQWVELWNGIVKCSLGKGAGLSWHVQNLVEEHGIV